MFSIIFKFILSILIFNWIYAELVLFSPSLVDFGSKVLEIAAIPTHDKWDFNIKDFKDLGATFAIAEQGMQAAYAKNLQGILGQKSLGRRQGSSRKSINHTLGRVFRKGISRDIQIF